MSSGNYPFIIEKVIAENNLLLDKLGLENNRCLHCHVSYLFCVLCALTSVFSEICFVQLENEGVKIQIKDLMAEVHVKLYTAKCTELELSPYVFKNCKDLWKTFFRNEELFFFLIAFGS